VLRFSCVFLVALCQPFAVVRAVELASLSSQNPDIVQLRKEIAENLRSTAQSGKLRHPLRIVRYKVKPGENFFSIMARVSQNADTLASLNKLPAPGALDAGDELLIPNARGVFMDSSEKKALYSNFQPRTGSEALSAVYELNKDRAHLVNGQATFYPGMRYEKRRLEYFNGTGFSQPLLTGIVSSGFGTRKSPFTRSATFHGGIDIAAPSGTPVYASRSGKVVFSGFARGYGNLIILNHEYGYETFYGHLSETLVQTGRIIGKGQLIGRVGSTGKSTGPHLHFEVRHNGQHKKPSFEHSLPVQSFSS
jgi:murein DD-endopeptidase MepM/ murein hydrolase activator NlpD